MVKDIGKIPKNKTTDIVIRIDEFRGKKGLTIREYVTSIKYTGFTRAGIRIPAEEFLNFRDIINSIDINEFSQKSEEESEEKTKEETEDKEEISKKGKNKEEKNKEESEED